MKQKRFDLDCLRVAAFFIVFMLHTKITTNVIVGAEKWEAKYFFFYMPAWAGVWMFFLLSGFLTGQRLLKDDADLTDLGILRFALEKIVKIGFPTWFFIFIIALIGFPDYLFDWKLLLRWLTFSYNGTPGVIGIGATWFVSTIMQLYFMAPFFCRWIRKLSQRKNGNYLCMGIFLLICILELAGRVFAYRIGLDWFGLVYTVSIVNLDLFFGGILCNVFCKSKKKNSCTALKMGISLLFTALVLYNWRV